jgi:hypothetical protein
MYKSYWDVLKYPMSIWILYIIIFSLLAFVGASNFSYSFLMGTGAFILAFVFGFWTGIRTSMHSYSMSEAMLNGFILGITVGFISFIFELGIAVLSYSFVGITGSTISLLPISISSWVIITMLAVLASAVGAEFKIKR